MRGTGLGDAFAVTASKGELHDNDREKHEVDT